MTNLNVPIRISLVVAAIIALLAVLTQFSPLDEDAGATRENVLPVAPARVERPLPPPRDGDSLLGPSRRAGRLAGPIEIDGQLEVIDATAFRYGQSLLRLRNLVGPARDAVCQAADGSFWGCGLQARAALVNAMRSGRTRCLPALDAPGERDGFQCWVGKDDLARLMVRNGWAKPAPLSGPSYADDLEAAVLAKAGLWRGAWPTGKMPSNPPGDPDGARR